MDRLPDDVWLSPGFDGKYRFEQLIATSAMAIVVRACHLELDENVAIKFLSPDAVRSPAAVARFRREARAAAKIKSQHVVRILDVSSTVTGIPYLVMEYLDGQDLERLLAQSPGRQVAIHDSVDFVLQASEALVEGHGLGIVHRDLKPANLFCVDRGDGYPLVKVLDFGILKLLSSTGDVERTDRHEILGSPRYMSPEQIDGAFNVDHRTDIWSIGIILYETIAGKSPFNAEFIPELWRKIRQMTPEPLSAVRQGCSAELANVVAKCMAKDPAKRYQDLGELAKALAPFAPERSRASIARICFTAESTSDVALTPSTYTDPCVRLGATRTGQHQRWLFAGGVALVLGTALSYAVVRRGQEAAPSHAEEPPIPALDAAHSIVDSRESVATPESSAATVSQSPVVSAPVIAPTRVQRPSSSSRKAVVFGATASSSSSVSPPSSAALAAPLDSADSAERPRWMIDPITTRKEGKHE